MAVALAAGALATPAEDWPEFRGPTGQGLSSAQGLPSEWTPTKNIAWKQAIPGQGWSSPVLSKGRVYLTAAVPGGGQDGFSLRVLCLDGASGKIRWNVEALAPPAARGPDIHRKNSHASATPLLEGDRLYAHFGHQGTACLGLDGQVVWRNTDLDYPPVHGNGGSPILVGDLLVFSCDGARDPFVAALDKATGKLRWRVPRATSSSKTFSFSTPLLITVAGRQQIITPGSGVVGALDPADGRELWRVRYGEGYSVVPRPVFGHGLLYVATGFDRPTVLAIRPGGSGDVTDTHVAWTVTRGAPNTPSPLLVGDELYLVSDSGIASCRDARTGRVHWEERVGGNFSASPVSADGKIYLQNEEGVCTVLKPGKEFAKLAVNDLGERTLASPAVSDGALFIRTEQNLYCIRTGK